MKVAVIGGGSTYTPELVNGFLERMSQLPLDELCLMDVDAGRLSVVGEFTRRIVRAAGSPFDVVLVEDRRQAITGSNYVITQLRVGQMQARREDEYLGRRYALIGQETTGVGGMAKALRTIPVILDIAREMRQLAAPDALLVNFTNPAGLVTQALQQVIPDLASVGVCNVPIKAKMDILERLEASGIGPIDPRRAHLDTLGLNHLSWHRGFTLDGKDLWEPVWEGFLRSLEDDPDAQWDARTLHALGMIPNYYLEYYYYTTRMLAHQAQWPPSRAEQVLALEADLLRQYRDPHLDAPPGDLMKRGGAYYSTVATQLINAHYNDLQEVHVVNLPNNGAVGEWPSHWVLEMPARISREAIQPIPTSPLPPDCFGLLAQVKAYELLVVQAAVHGDRQAAYRALLAHPLGPDADRVQAVLDDMLAINREHLPGYWDIG
ncbi:MAG: family 4 glycosyl hydrolase [Anaerolineales bacterium]